MKKEIKISIIETGRYPEGFDKGWGNGYVLLPNDHIYYEKHYDEIDVNVHCGLTFSKKVDDIWIKAYNKNAEDEYKLNNDDLGKWMIGFDTAHYMDDLESWPKERVLSETIKLKDQLI